MIDMQSNYTTITTLIDCDVCAGRNLKYKSHKWSGFVDGENGFFYGIPYDALRVIKFNPMDKSVKEIGPNLGDDILKWRVGVRSSRNDKIYCMPYKVKTGKILIIDTTNDEVKELDFKPPESGSGWASGALAADGNIYFFPNGARRILKVDTQNDNVKSVGNDLGSQYGKYSGTVASKDGQSIYGIPYKSKRILKYHLSNSRTTVPVGNEATQNLLCSAGVLSPDSNTIFAIKESGQILTIRLDDDSWTFRGNSPKIMTFRGNFLNYIKTWGIPIVGFDQNIYFPPTNYNQVLMYDPFTFKKSLVGDFLTSDGEYLRYREGAIASDGLAYFPPLNGNHILQLYTGSHAIIPHPFARHNGKNNSNNILDIISNVFIVFGIVAIGVAVYLKKNENDVVEFELIETAEIVENTPQNDQTTES